MVVDAVMAHIFFIRSFIRLKENKKREIFECLKESRKLNFIPMRVDFLNTGNDRYSGDGISGIDRFSGTESLDDAFLFTVSGITAIVEQKFRKVRVFFLKILMQI